MDNDFRARAARLWHAAMELRRADIFGPNDPLRPTYSAGNPLAGEVDTAAVGALGGRYRPGGLALLSVNPAAGRSTARQIPSSAALYRAYAELRRAGSPGQIRECFEAANARFFESLPDWGISKQYVLNILDAVGKETADIAYLYLVPFRTAGDGGSTMEKAFLEEGYSRHLRQQLEFLRPGFVVTMDRPAERAARRYAAGARQPPCEVIYFTRKRDAHAQRRALLAELRMLRDPGRALGGEQFS